MGALPVNSERLYEILKELDYPWVDENPVILLKRMQTVVPALKSELTHSDELLVVMEEFFIHEQPTVLSENVRNWLLCAVFNQVGRQLAKHNIISYFDSKSESIPGSKPEPSPEDPPVIEVENTSGFAAGFQAELKFASKRAEQLLKSQTISFDGISNPNFYSIFKHDIRELVQSSGSPDHSLVSFECALAALRGPAQREVRRYVSTHDLYRDPKRVSKLWRYLDSLYLTTDSVRFISELFNSCQQKPGESLPLFISRFQRLALIWKDQNGRASDDTELTIKLSAAITSHSAIMARGIVDSMRITSFSQYCIQLVNVARSMEQIVNTITQRGPHEKTTAPQVSNLALAAKQFCLQCGESDHTRDTCTRQVKYACRHCGSMEHFNRACPKNDHPNGRRTSTRFNQPSRRDTPITQANPMAAAMHESEGGQSSIIMDLHEVDPDLSPTANTVSVICAVSSGKFDNRLVDTVDPMQNVVIKTKYTHLAQSCLIDTGAGANFVSQKLAESLIRARAVDKKDIRQLPSPLTIMYGNSTKEQADCVIPIMIKVDSTGAKWIEILAVVTRSASYPMILGRTGLKQLGIMPDTTPSSFATPVPQSVTAQNAAFEIEPGTRSPLVTITADNRIQVHHAILEDAMVLPYRAPRRSRSLTDMAIIHAKLEQMVRQGKLEKCSSRDAHMVHEVVLVDKQSEKRLPRSIPHDDGDLKRYRITLDLRCGNDLQLVSIGDGKYAFLPNDFAGNERSAKTASDHQFQLSALDILKQLPGGLKVFAKLDLDDAYSSVLVPPSLRGLFCYSCPTPHGGEYLYYRWNCLVQGWRWSPLFFSIAVEFILDMCRAENLSTVYLRHYQDDILIAGDTHETVKGAMLHVMQKFRNFGFTVNESKTHLADHTIFCGYHLSGEGISPHPKSQITTAFFETTWELFINAKSNEARLSLLRQWAGRFNYFLGFLSATQLGHLRSIYSCISVLMRDPKSFDGDMICSLRGSLSSLCDHVAMGRIPTFPCGFMPNTLFSIICTDANIDSYSGILFRLCKSDTKPDLEYMPEIRTLLSALQSQLALEVSVEEMVLVPVRISGGHFSQSEQKQSSTYRERVCQLRCLDSFYHLLYGTVVMVSDNQNVGRTWHSLDETLSYGSNLIPWQRFISTVRHTIWVPRKDSIVSLADFLARVIAPPKAQISKSLTISPRATAPPDLHINSADVEETQETPANHILSLPQLVLPIREALQTGYLTDTTTYMHVQMRDVFQFISHGTKSSDKVEYLASRFLIHNGLLYHVRTSGPPQIYVPAGGKVALYDETSGTIRASILYHYHDSPLGMHRGYQKLAPEIANAFWWPSLLGDCLLYCKSCKVCLAAKLRFTKFKGELSGISAEQPFSHWIIDFAGPIRGHGAYTDTTYVLIAICAFSSYCLLMPTGDCTARTTSRTIFDRIVCQFGIPQNIYSDRGTSFDADVIREMNLLLGVTWRMSSSYSPRTQGSAERFIQHMKICFQILDFKWEQLPLIQLMHNSSRIGSSPLCPHEIIFGLRPNTFLPESPPSESSDLWIKIIETRMVWQAFKSLMRDRQADAYSLRSEPVQFNPGDQVFRIFVTSTRKTQRTGPFRIVRKISRNMYEISDHSYPIPEYQLHYVTQRPEHLAITSPQMDQAPVIDDAPDISRGKTGDMVAYETVDGSFDGLVSYDVGEWVERDLANDQNIKIIRYWYNQHGQWICWSRDDYTYIHVNQIRSIGFRLTQHKIPKALKKKLLN